MSIISTVAPSLPSRASLVKATVIALVVAAVLLATVVLPAEYGIDPTGIGRKLGLTVLADAAAPADEVTNDPIPASSASDTSDAAVARNAAEAAKAAQAFGVNDKQSFAAQAFAPATGKGAPTRETLTVTLAPRKGAEVKTLLAAGQSLVFHWIADGDVAVDMHGERTGVKGAWTSYSVEAAQREAAGAFTAPFDGSHGWYWENRGNDSVTVQIEVTGFQDALYQP